VQLVGARIPGERRAVVPHEAHRLVERAGTIVASNDGETHGALVGELEDRLDQASPETRSSALGRCPHLDEVDTPPVVFGLVATHEADETIVEHRDE
jgi:hypothetical protein